jgi:hypothetical protein
MALEYTTSVVILGLLGRNRAEVTRDDLEGELNLLGAEGWELSHVCFDVALQHEKDGHRLVFKRQA